MALTTRGALAWSLFERYASLVLTVASTMVLARLLTPAQVGIFSMCAAVTAVAGILRDFGVSEFLIQEKELTRDKLRSAFGVAVLVAWSIGGVVFFARGYIAAFYGEPGIAEVLSVLSLNFLLLPLASPAFALLNRELAFRKIFVVQTSSNAVHGITAVALAFHGHGYMSLAWAPVASIVTQAVLLTFLRPRDSLLFPGFRGARQVMAYGSMFVTSRVIETVARNAHEFIIAKQFGFAPVGLFSRGFGLIDLFYQNVTSAVLRVATPAFAADHRAGVSLVASFARGTAIMTSLAWPFFGYVALMSLDILDVLFGHQWEAAAPITTMLALGTIPGYLGALAPNVLIATGHVRRRLQVAMLFSPIHVVCILLAASIGFEAVAAVWILTNTIGVILYTRHLREVLQASVRQLYAASIPSAVLAAASVAVQAAVMGVCHRMGLAGYLSLALVGCSGALAWLVTARLLKHPAFEEILRIWNGFRRRRG